MPTLRAMCGFIIYPEVIVSRSGLGERGTVPVSRLGRDGSLVSRMAGGGLAELAYKEAVIIEMHDLAGLSLAPEELAVIAVNDLAIHGLYGGSGISNAVPGLINTGPIQKRSSRARFPKPLGITQPNAAQMPPIIQRLVKRY